MNLICVYLIVCFGVNYGSNNDLVEECRSIFFINLDRVGGVLYRLGEYVVYILSFNG